MGFFFNVVVFVFRFPAWHGECLHQATSIFPFHGHRLKVQPNARAAGLRESPARVKVMSPRATLYRMGTTRYVTIIEYSSLELNASWRHGRAPKVTEDCQELF